MRARTDLFDYPVAPGAARSPEWPALLCLSRARSRQSGAGCLSSGAPLLPGWQGSSGPRVLAVVASLHSKRLVWPRMAAAVGASAVCRPAVLVVGCTRLPVFLRLAGWCLLTVGLCSCLLPGEGERRESACKTMRQWCKAGHAIDNEATVQDRARIKVQKSPSQSSLASNLGATNVYRRQTSLQ